MEADPLMMKVVSMWMRTAPSVEVVLMTVEVASKAVH